MAIEDDVRARTAACPSCGAPLRFRGATSVVAVCAFCRATVVREGVKLEDVGRQADLLPDASRIQLGTEGGHRGARFTVVGRIQYRYGSGVWNEWHVLTAEGKSGWLSDANLEHTITYLAQPAKVPAFAELGPGGVVTLAGDRYVVTNLEQAEVVAGEGELPFRFTSGWKAPVADLRGEGTRFGTIDYSEGVPHIYLGERLPFDTFRFAGLRDPDRPLEPGGRALVFKCAWCGAPIEKHVAASEVVACVSCGSVTDVTGSSGEIVQKAERNQKKLQPLIPLGTVGTWRGAKYEVVGYMRRAIVVESVTYEWGEYLLHSLTEGYLWISEYQGHYSVIKATTEMPRPVAGGLWSASKPSVRYLGKKFEHFQRANARVTRLAGEFNWRVQVGDRCQVDDYVAPPLILSSETTDNEITWSLGEYVEPPVLWKAMGLPGAPRKPTGVAPNQPAPVAGRVHLYWLVFIAFLLAGLGAQVAFMGSDAVARPAPVPFTVDGGGTARVVSRPFEIGGWFSGPVTLRTASSATNTWLGLDLQLTNADTGRAWRLDRQLGYRMVGQDLDGSAEDVAEIDSLPPGRYTLAIDARAGPVPVVRPGIDRAGIVGSVQVYRNRVGWSNFLLYAGFLFLWPLGIWMRRRAFEHQRWSESDYPPQSAVESSDDD